MTTPVPRLCAAHCFQRHGYEIKSVVNNLFRVYGFLYPFPPDFCKQGSVFGEGIG